MLLRYLLCAVLLGGCASPSPRPSSNPVDEVWVDMARTRPVPVRIYGDVPAGRPRPLAILSHGYGGHNTDYGFLADELARLGYLVVSIEHLERPGDPPMINSGDLATLRRPVWKVGADSIAFAIEEARKRGLGDASAGVLVVGHSNGGDMTMLFATEHPEQVAVALSLDNRRMPLPRTSSPGVCSVRSSDLAADDGVLPSPEEQSRLGMLIATVPVRHDDMWDVANPEQKAAILDAVARCLNQAAAGRT